LVVWAAALLPIGFVMLGWEHSNPKIGPTALQAGMTRDELMKALDGHAKGATGIIGTFSKP
jgi:hypothetical protein